MPVVLASLAGTGVFLLYTAVVLGWRAVGPVSRFQRPTRRARRRFREWLTQVGLGDVRVSEFVAVVGALAVLGALLGYVVFAGPLAALAVGAFAGSFPVAAYRRRRQARRGLAMDAWPRMIEEIRVLVGSSGRSIPQALFEVGRRAPAELTPAFEAAHREWLITTDFARTLGVLKAQLADPTADATCETLLIAHEVGGADLDQRLEALAEDRRQDVQGRKDARARQAGVRFARRFVLVVPLGMAVAGMSVGTGRAAYQTPVGQLLVVIGLALVVVCWIWAGQLMRLPEQERVFPE